MVRKSQRVWIIFVGLFIALMAAFIVPKTEEREVHAASFTISSYDDLKYFRDGVNAGDSSYVNGSVTLTRDITITNTDIWTPIGTYARPFRGTFNGNGHTISGMHVQIGNSSQGNLYDNGDVYAGFFGCTDGARINNFTIRDSLVEVYAVRNTYAGGIIGGVIDANFGTELNGCTYDGTGGSFVSHDIIVDNLSQYGTIYRAHAAGLVGIAASDMRAFYMSNCSVVGSPTIESTGYISYVKSASFIGYGETSIISKCWSDAQIKCIKNSTTGDACVGGCVGYMTVGELNDSYFVGSVNVEKKDNCDVQVGGLIGKAAPNDEYGLDLKRNYSTGDVKITTSITTKNYIGKLVGRLSASNGSPLNANNVYYLNSSTLTPTNATIYNIGTSKTSAQFASGEIACRLNNTSGTDPVSGGGTWYQSIDNNLNPHDSYPVLNSSRGKVYEITTCGGMSVTAFYSNNNTTTNHNFDNGICKRCGAYQQPGSSGDYYQIDNAGKLYWFAAVVNDIDRDRCQGNPSANNAANAKLTSDITLNSNINDTNARLWKPIGRFDGTSDYSFSGIFDGNNKTISGMKVNMTSGWSHTNYTYAGFFGHGSGTVKNLKITNSSVSVNCNVSTCFAGGLCGNASGTYENCNVDCSVYVNNSTGANHGVGGMFGILNSSGRVNNCIAKGKVETASTNPGKHIGGFVGYLNSGKIENSFSEGEVIAKHANSGSEFKVGGFAGLIQGGSVINSGTTSKVTATDNNSSTSDFQSGTGGFAGNAKDFTLIENCYAKGNVSLTSAYKGTVAGFIGFLHNSQTNGGTTYCNVKKCFATGNVTHTTSASSGACYTGGFVGDNWNQNTGSSTTFENCYAWGNCTFNQTSSSSNLNIHAGGFAANLHTPDNNTSYVRNCYAIGNVTATGSGTKFLGSFVGASSNVDFSNCYTLNSNIVSAGSYYYNGTPKSLTEFESGEVTYLLNNNTSGGEIWRQNLKSENSSYDSYPILDSTHKKVYYAYKCGMNTRFFINIDPDADANDVWSTEPMSHAFNDTCNGFCIRCGNGYQAPTAGTGDQNSPYEITNAGQLYWFACVVNGGDDLTNKCQIPSGQSSISRNQAACAKLTKDIVINPAEEISSNDARLWTPIGTSISGENSGYPNAYKGIFDGDGHTISGMKVDITSTTSNVYAGLFGFVYSASIQNVGVINSYVKAVSDDYNVNAGGLVGWNTGTISNSYSKCNVDATGSGNVNTGSLVGYTSDTIINNYATGDVSATGSGNVNAGGLVGCQNSGTISNNYSISKITIAGSGLGAKTAGKLVGYQSGGSIDNSYYCSDDSVSSITNNGGTFTTTVVGTSKLAAEFNNFAVKDLLQNYVNNNSTPSNQLSSWVQAENSPEFGWDNHELSTTISWNSLTFGYDPSTGLWSIPEDDKKITFVNGSTGAKLRYTAEFNSPEVSGIIGEISHTSGNWTYQGDAWPMVNSSDMTNNTNSRITTLSLSGAPNISGFDSTTESSPMQIGTITLTISG